MKKIIPVILIISIFLNIYLIFFGSNKKLENNAFCAQFKEQASERIRTYYTDGSIANTYPDEIFYSNSRNTCIAVWTGIQNNYDNNGNIQKKVIFDAVTNENIFSGETYRFYDEFLNKQFNDNNAEVLLRYYELLNEVHK